LERKRQEEDAKKMEEFMREERFDSPPPFCCEFVKPNLTGLVFDE